MVKLIEKKYPKTYYVMELDHEEMKEIWSVVGTAAFSCEETLKDIYKNNPENMKERIKLLRSIEKSFHDCIFDD